MAWQPATLLFRTQISLVLTLLVPISSSQILKLSEVCAAARAHETMPMTHCRLSTTAGLPRAMVPGVTLCHCHLLQEALPGLGHTAQLRAIAGPNALKTLRAGKGQQIKVQVYQTSACCSSQQSWGHLNWLWKFDKKKSGDKIWKWAMKWIWQPIKIILLFRKVRILKFFIVPKHFIVHEKKTIS